MNPLVKVGIGAAFIGALVWGWKTAKSAISDFGFEIVAYGKPKFSGSFITVPLQIKVTNPTPLPISLDNVTANVFVNKNGKWVHGATASQALTIPSGESFQIISPSLNIGSIFGGSIWETLVSASNIFQAKSLDLSTDVAITYKGIVLPKKSFTNTIQL